jgi:predicted nucleic acid-binding protein
MTFMSVVSQLEFVDTNILIYAHDLSAGKKHLRARELIQELWENRTGCLSIQVLQEFFVNVTLKVANPLATETASQIVADLAVWRVHRPGVEDILDAIRFHNRYQISFWDAMIVVSALQLGCDTIWSEDLNPDQVYERAVIVNPLK